MSRVLSFGRFQLDPLRQCLNGPDGETVLRRKNFEVLDFLLRQGGTIVGKRRLMDAVWGDAAVTEESLTKCISELRAALGEEGPEIIKTVPRRGYRIAPVVIEQDRSDSKAKTATRPPLLSVIVLPFTNLSGARARDYLADGITEDLTSDLACIEGTFVIARNTAFEYKARKIDFREIGTQLGVRFAVEGSVREISEGLRINVQLIDVGSSAHVWAKRLDIGLAEFMSGIDEIVLGLANALGISLVETAAKRHDQTAPEALDLILRARAALHAPVMPCRGYFAEIRSLFDAALALDPHTADALVGRAHVDVFEYSIFDTDIAGLATAEALIEKALRLALKHAQARYARAYIYSMTGRMAAAKAEAETAIALDRTMVNAYGRLAQIENFLGHPDTALEWIAKVKRISPLDRFTPYWEGIEAHSRVLLGQDEEAIVLSRKLLAAGYTPKFIYYFLIASLTHLGQTVEAATTLEEFKRRHGRFGSITQIKAAERSSEPAFLRLRQRLYEGLLKAGVPA